MSSQLDIYNRALARIGIDQGIGDPNETSKQGTLYRLWYDVSVRACLRDFAWPFATRIIAAAPLPTPLIGWQYAYAYPDDCLFARALCDQSGIRTMYLDVFTDWFAEPQPSHFGQLVRYPVPFKVMGITTGAGANQRVIVCDLPNAYLTYTANIADPNQFDEGFADALAWKIAAEIAGPFLGAPAGQQVAMQCGKYYANAVLTARAQALNEQGADYRPPSPAIAARF